MSRFKNLITATSINISKEIDYFPDIKSIIYSYFGVLTSSTKRGRGIIGIRGNSFLFPNPMNIYLFSYLDFCNNAGSFFNSVTNVFIDF